MEAVRRAVSEQLATLRLLWGHEHCWVPLLIVCSATLGGALHSPVMAFFFLEVGADVDEIGNIQFLSSCMALLSSPLWGRVMDIGKGQHAHDQRQHQRGAAAGSSGSSPRSSAPGSWTGAERLGKRGGSTPAMAPPQPSTGLSRLFSRWFGDLNSTTGGYVAVGSAGFLCALGCLLQGLATSVDMLYAAHIIIGLGGSSLFSCVLGHICSVTPIEDRSRIVGSYLAQVTALRIVGKLAYPPWHRLLAVLGLGESRQLLRDRVTMSVCTVFCIFGFCLLVGRFLHRRYRGPLLGYSTVSTTGDGGGAGGDDDDAASKGKRDSPTKPHSARSNGSPDRDGAASPARDVSLELLAAGVGLVAQSFALTILNVLWPLYVRAHYGWAHEAFAYLLLASAVAGTLCVAAFPAVSAAMGLRRITFLGFVAATLLSLLAFQFGTPTPRHMAAHVVVGVVLFGVVSFLQPALLSLISQARPQAQQGTSFGIMNSLAGVGAMSGSLIGTRLYERSRLPGGDENLPMYCAAATLGLAAAGLVVASLQHRAS